MTKRRKRPVRAGRVFLYLSLLSFSFIFLFPLYLAIVNSLQGWYSVPTVLPDTWNWSNYYYATTMIDFWRYTRNSLIISSISVITTTLSSGMVGYAFARLKAPGKNALFMLVISTMMVPGIVTQIPTYVLFNQLNLLNTFWPWFLWGIGGSAFYIFMYRQFFVTIPVELEEAARIDGCSYFRIYWNIFLPISKPLVATAMILIFHGSWNDVTGPFMYLKEQRYPLATALSMIGYKELGSNITINQISIAGGLLLAIPVIVTFFVGQKNITQGIATTGIKG